MAIQRNTPAKKLAAYKAKRDFKKTPEPDGKQAIKNKTASSLRFCVQKHLASHLHYDFRLEHHGVLLSWAVPRGPSLRPTDKRLAMKVEDHPLDYRTFEGVIPKGYGAGIVMLWDEGEWFPEVDDVEAALKKGDLKFRLEGTKLKGSWALIRTHSSRSDDDRSWLLIKHRDPWAGEIDITQFAPLSVKSFGDFPDILGANQPKIWESHRPAATGKAGELLHQVIDEVAKRRKSKPKKRVRQKSSRP